MEIGGLSSGYISESNDSLSEGGLGDLISLASICYWLWQAKQCTSPVQAKGSCCEFLLEMAVSCSADNISPPCYLCFSSCVLHAFSFVIKSILSFQFCFRDYNIIKIFHFYLLSFQILPYMPPYFFQIHGLLFHLLLLHAYMYVCMYIHVYF